MTAGWRPTSTRGSRATSGSASRARADEVRRDVREILHCGADFIKVIATGAVLTEGTDPGAPEFTEDELRAAVEEAALYGTYVAAHAHGAEGIKRAIRAGVRSIEHGSLMDDEAIEMMADAAPTSSPTCTTATGSRRQGRAHGWSANVLRKNDETTDAQREGFAKCVEARREDRVRDRQRRLPARHGARSSSPTWCGSG